MTSQPGDQESEEPGGRAAERLREHLAKRFPGGLPHGATGLEEEEEPKEDTSGDSAQEADEGTRTDTKADDPGSPEGGNT